MAQVTNLNFPYFPPHSFPAPPNVPPPQNPPPKEAPPPPHHSPSPPSPTVKPPIHPVSPPPPRTPPKVAPPTPNHSPSPPSPAVKPPIHPVSPPPPRMVPSPPPPPHTIPPPPHFVPPPPHFVPSPPHPSPPPPPPGHHPTVIIFVFVSLGGVFFLAFLAAALFCCAGPHGPQMVVLSIEDDVHIEEEIKKNEIEAKGSHWRSPKPNSQALEMVPSTSESNHLHHHDSKE